MNLNSLSHYHLVTTSVDNDTIDTTLNNGTNLAAGQRDIDVIEMQSTTPATIAPLVVSPRKFRVTWAFQVCTKVASP
jgi:hypothetical protein